MNGYIGIRVSEQSLRVGYRYPPEPQIAARGESVYIISKAYPHYFLLLTKSLMPARSKPRVKRIVLFSGLVEAVAMQ